MNYPLCRPVSPASRAHQVAPKVPHKFSLACSDKVIATKSLLFGGISANMREHQSAMRARARPTDLCDGGGLRSIRRILAAGRRDEAAVSEKVHRK